MYVGIRGGYLSATVHGVGFFFGPPRCSEQTSMVYLSSKVLENLHPISQG
jgi:hypothetical protein